MLTQLKRELYRRRAAKRKKAEELLQNRKDEERSQIQAAKEHRATLIRSSADRVRFREEFGLGKAGSNVFANVAGGVTHRDPRNRPVGRKERRS